MRSIRVELRDLAEISSNIQAENRTEFIAKQKEAIYFLRNQLLSAYFDQAISNEHILKNEYGKPYLALDSKAHFNHSHTKQSYALAMSAQVQDIGLDIEELSRKVRFEALAQHAFHLEEYQQWKALDEDPEYWFKVWTTKEAVLKASGLGIRINLNTLNTHVSAYGSGGVCQHEAIGSFAYQHYVIGHAMLTVAWRAEPSCLGFQFPHIYVLQH